MANIGISSEYVAKRVQKIKAIRDGIHVKGVENFHVKVMGGNTKTGKTVHTVSLAPILDCKNCSLCKTTCYDIAHDCRFTETLETRAINSAIHKYDNERYWNEIGANIIAQGIVLLRINVGGDLSSEDFPQLKRIAETYTRTTFLFFTKNVKELNEFLDTNEFPENVKVMVSRWCGDKVDNRHNLPESHLLFTKHSHDAVEEFLLSDNKDLSLMGKTSCTRTKQTYLCGGNCSVCYLSGVGCWNMPKNTDLILIAH